MATDNLKQNAPVDEAEAFLQETISEERQINYTPIGGDHVNA
jgi:hypothetical protein